MADTNYRMPVAQSQAIVEALAGFSDISLAIVFGSVATGSARPDSDLDIAVASARGPLAAAEKISMIQALAEKTGRPIDLIDLATVGQPLLGQVVQHGQKIRGSSTAYGQLISRHVLDEADFMPYVNRILTERRLAWIGR